MPNLTKDTNLTGTITLSKATGTKVTLDTDHKYLTRDIELTINVPTSTVTSSGATVSYTSGWVNAGSTTVTDANLIAGNIKSGVSIFGVTGTYDIGVSAISITDTTDSAGGTIRTVTAINISDTTAIASDVASGKYFYTAEGVRTQGTASGGTINLQAKTNINPSTSSQTITADNGYDGLSSVQINAMPAMTLPTSASSSATSGYSSKATISRSTSDQYINISTGYNSAGAYYKINAVANGSATGPSSLNGTSASVSTGTNTLTLTKTGVSTTPTVSAGYVSSATSSTATVTLTASVTTKAAATITPGTSNQTIASGTYLTGTQTISGDANLVAGNIISGKTIFGVAGSVVIQHYYTGSGTPSNSTGENGDIYLKTS